MISMTVMVAQSPADRVGSDIVLSYEWPDLVRCANEFLINALPFRFESHGVVRRFVEVIRDRQVSVLELDALLVQCLAVMDRHIGPTRPSLVEHYLFNSDLTALLDTFLNCIENVIYCEGVVDPRVKQAIMVITAYYSNPTLSPQH